MAVIGAADQLVAMHHQSVAMHIQSQLKACLLLLCLKPELLPAGFTTTLEPRSPRARLGEVEVRATLSVVAVSTASV
jgi:hypothetical protein